MKIHRFYTKQPLGEETVEIKAKDNKELLHQWGNVLRFKENEKVILFNENNDFDFTYNIKTINKNTATLTLEHKTENLKQIKEKGIEINLCMSIIKKDNLDLVLQKCTELGVSNFIPIISERVEKKNLQSFNIERSQKIITEACEQSGWGHIPNISKAQKLEDAIKSFENEGDIYICDIESPDFDKEVKILQTKTKKIYLFIGPEGGWTDNESEKFKKYFKNNLKIISFGKNVLRAETCAITASSIFCV